MLTNYEKKEGRGQINGIKDMLMADINFKNELNELYITSAREFGSSVSEVILFISSSGFWLGEELHTKANVISSTFAKVVTCIMNGSVDSNTMDIVKNMNSLIRDFEKSATRYFDLS